MIASFAFAYQPPVLFTVVASKLAGMASGIVAVNNLNVEERGDPVLQLRRRPKGLPLPKLILILKLRPKLQVQIAYGFI